MKSRSFRNLDVRIIKAGAGYVASIETPDGQRALAAFNLSLDDYELKYYVSQVTRGPTETRRGATDQPQALAEKFGTTLFNAVFTGPVREYLDTSMNESNTDQGLRLRLDLQGAPDLAGLPWEYLYHPDRSLFLALSPDTALVRYVQVAEPPAPLQVKPPLRILGVACSPKDQQQLDLVKERHALEQALSRAIESKIATIDWLPTSSLEALTEAVDNNTYHIFHFVGHGVFANEGDEASGYLLFEDQDGYSSQVSSRDLGWVLRRSVKLAVINACESARGNAGDPSTGVASSLILQGIPAVIAMQFQITDAVASKFAELLYGSLALGLPVDSAVTAARRGVMAAFQGSAEWGTPTLYLRAPNGQIFDVEHEAISALARNVPSTSLRDLVNELNGKVELPEMVKDWGEWVGGRFPFVNIERPKSAPAAKPDLGTSYEQARQLMEQERWAEACAIFARINSIAPGYRDIAQLWQESQEQGQLSGMYKRLVTDYAAANWQRVLSDAEAILARDGDYKDTRQMVAKAQAMLRPPQPAAPLKPAGLPPPGPAAGVTSPVRGASQASRSASSLPDQPPSPGQPPAAGKPVDLPGGPLPGGKPKDLPDNPSIRSGKPSNLPG